MSESIVLMTGATSGFGGVVASHIVTKGNVLVVFARSQKKAEHLINTIKARNTSVGKIEYIQCDLSSFDSVIAACNSFKQRYKKVNTIIHNAGIMNFNFKHSKDNIEETLQVNLLSPMLINCMLFENIDTSSEAKVIFTASGLHQGTIQFDDIEFKKKFSSFRSYRQSKLGVILMARLLAKKWAANNINVYSIHPGVVRTKLGRNAGWFARFFFWAMGSSLKKGAETHLHLLDEPAAKLNSGEYYAKSTVTSTTKEAYDIKLAEKLYSVIGKFLNSIAKTEHY